MVPFSTETMPVGHSRTATSNGQDQPAHRTSSISGPLARPGCTRYQWPSSMASLTAPRNTAPTSIRPTDRAAGSPAASPAATSPTSPIIGATRSRCGGNSGPPSNVRPSRSMPVMAATRAIRRSSVPRWPATPARRRTTETTMAAVVATTTPIPATSRTGSVSTKNPTTTAPAAIRPKVIRMVQP